MGVMSYESRVKKIALQTNGLENESLGSCLMPLVSELRGAKL